MKIYFPQWQGSGTGEQIEQGADTILKSLKDPEYQKIPLTPAAKDLATSKKHHINQYESIVDQLSRFYSFLEQKQPEKLQIIGGDCGLEIVPVSYLNEKYPNLGVIWFDAHADINRPCDSPSCNFHGMPLRTLLGEGEQKMDTLMFSKLGASQIHYVGLRDIDPAEQERIHKGNIFSTSKRSPENLIDILRTKKIKNLYLHFDVDCLDPQTYQKTYYQVAHGINIETAIAYIRDLKEVFNLVGCSLLESVATSPTELKPISPIIQELLVDSL